MSAVLMAAIFTIGFLVVVIAWMVFSRRSRDSAWEELAQSMGARFLPGGLFKSSRVEARVRQWVLLLDSYSVPSGDSSTTYTRIRSNIPNAAALQFRIFPEGLVARLDKALGLKDLEIGVPEFDRGFVVQGSNEKALRALLANGAIRQLILEQRPSQLSLHGQELRLEVKGVVEDVGRLRALFRLCELTIEQLTD